eukprot:tig00000950_g5771.t1
MGGLERLCFRALRGIMYLRSRDVAEPISDPSRTSRSRRRSSSCTTTGGRAERELMLDDVERRVADVRSVIEQTDVQRKSLLEDLAAQLAGWQKRVLREAAIAHALNHFASGADLLSAPSCTPGSGAAPAPAPQPAALEMASKERSAREKDGASRKRVMVGEAWCPVDRIDDVRVALLIGQRRSGVSVPSVLNAIKPRGAADHPPTLFKANKFTRAFQEIVDAYGVARYREINPAVLTCVTFPFLFGVMFGDVGHGLLMLAFALFLVLRERALAASPSTRPAPSRPDGPPPPALPERRRSPQMVEMAFAGRYVLLLMASSPSMPASCTTTVRLASPPAARPPSARPSLAL